ncbi:hypothetical protein IFM89_025740, partial [Coptis chinensis]
MFRQIIESGIEKRNGKKIAEEHYRAAMHAHPPGEDSDEDDNEFEMARQQSRDEYQRRFASERARGIRGLQPERTPMLQAQALAKAKVLCLSSPVRRALGIPSLLMSIRREGLMLINHPSTRMTLTRRFLMNFMVYCDGLMTFDSSVDLSKHKKDHRHLLKHMRRVVDKVGKENVVQIVTDNGANFKKAGEMLVDKDDKPTMPFLHRWVEITIEQVRRKIRSPEWIVEIIKRRWNNQLGHPLHKAAHYLNPAVIYGPNSENVAYNGEFLSAMQTVINQLIPNLSDQLACLNECKAYREAS